MNRHETAWQQKIIVLSIVILVVVSAMTSARPVSARVATDNFDAVDNYISTKIKELGIPGAALVVVQGDQIVHLQAFGVADGSGRPVSGMSTPMQTTPHLA